MAYQTVLLVLPLLLVSTSAAALEIVFADGFETGDTTGWWAPARVASTGQVTCSDETGEIVACADTGQDGDVRPGVPWPQPRFVDNGDGTVSDMLTGLVWLKDASCAELLGSDDLGLGTWETALSAAIALSSGTCGLSDDSVPGDWHLPTVNELQSVVAWEYHWPAVSNSDGTAQWVEGDPFNEISTYLYWSATSYSIFQTEAWAVYIGDGFVESNNKLYNFAIWPVRNPS